MTGTSRTKRLRARIDRLPAGWIILLAGFLLQIALAAGVLVRAALGGEDLELLVAGVLVGMVIVAGLATLPAFVLLWAGRFTRIAAAMAGLVGAGLFLFTEGHLTILPYALAALATAVRAWAGAGLDTEELLRLDPERFERVDPPTAGCQDRGDRTSDPAEGQRDP